MPRQEQIDRIHAQWQALGLDPRKHNMERDMLYGILRDDENVEGLTSCYWSTGKLVEANKADAHFGAK